mgnify:CR=1 FL=1
MKNLVFLTKIQFIFVINTITMQLISTKITEINLRTDSDSDSENNKNRNKNRNILLSIKESTYRDADFLKLKRMLMSSCNSENCFPLQGTCKGEKCVCLEGYLTIPTPNEPHSCNYVQKKVIFALLLETFGLIGFGHIYCERYYYGFIKIIWFFINIFYGVQFVMAFMKENVDTNAAHYVKLVISLICLSIPVIWHFVDLYNFSIGDYKDGNGVDLLFY